MIGIRSADFNDTEIADLYQILKKPFPPLSEHDEGSGDPHAVNFPSVSHVERLVSAHLCPVRTHQRFSYWW